MIRLYPILLLTFIIISFSCKETTTQNFNHELRFESSNGKETATYEEMMKFYKAAAEYSPQATLRTYGITDCGLPLHVLSYHPSKPSDKTLHLLINNGIHPGESDGIDASMLMLKDILNQNFNFPENVTLHIIPSYNLGGMLNRNTSSRANQNGPEAYGFRGNARNFDLNRDFMKMDTKNMTSFAEIYHDIKPDVYVETHVSNGADYQYTLTHLITQHDKLGHTLGEYTDLVFREELEQRLNSKNHIITPYVNVHGKTPFAGFSQFFDSPRYSTGYTSLWNSLGLMIETHMLKPYKKRVISTKIMLETLIELASDENESIKSLRAENFENFQELKYYPFSYKVDSTTYDVLNFKGFEPDYIKSEITGKARLKYNSNLPVEKGVKYYNQFRASDSLKIPDYYILKSSWTEVVDRLKQNKIKMTPLETDTLITVEMIKISDYNTYPSPYEGHYPHYNTTSEYFEENIAFSKGDLLIPTRQKGLRYIIESLEPELKDSFFNWNFFDTVLQQKEGYSAYVFEDYALNYLKDHPDVNAEFINKKNRDENFRNNTSAQLRWIYKQSPLYEKAHLRLPVFRVFD